MPRYHQALLDLAVEATTPLTIDGLAEAASLTRKTALTYVAAIRRAGIRVPLREPEPTPVELATDRVRQWAEGAPRQPFRLKEVCAALSDIASSDTLSSLISRALAILVKRGTLVRLGGADGYAWSDAFATQANGAGEELTIARLEALVESAAQDRQSACAPPRGHRTLDDWKRVTHLTASQVRDARTALNRISLYFGLESDSPLPFTLTAWDPVNEDWGGLQGPAKAAGGSRGKVLAGGRLVLHLAANHGLVVRAGTFPIAPSFYAWIDAMAMQLEPRDRHARYGARVGLRSLAKAATALGVGHPAGVKWPRIRDAIVSGEIPITDSARRMARTAYNRLAEVVRGGPEWEWKSRAHISTLTFLSFPERKSLSAVADGRATPDWSSWALPAESGEFAPLETLVHGTYGIARWVTWVTAHEATLEGRGLPPRAYPDGRRDPWRGFTLNARTLESRLYLLTRYITWAHRHGGVSMHCADLRDLVAPALARRYHEWLEERGMASVASLGQLFIALATLSSPYLEAVALQHDDRSLAERLKRDKRLLAKMFEEIEPSPEERREKHRSIAGAYTTVSDDGEERGLEKLRRLRDLQMEDIAEEVGLSIEDQLARLRTGETQWVTHSWARMVRDAFLVNLLRKIPLRAAEVVKLGVASHPDPKRRWASWHADRASADPRTGSPSRGPGQSNCESPGTWSRMARHSIRG